MNVAMTAGKAIFQFILDENFTSGGASSTASVSTPVAVSVGNSAFSELSSAI